MDALGRTRRAQQQPSHGRGHRRAQEPSRSQDAGSPRAELGAPRHPGEPPRRPPFAEAQRGAPGARVRNRPGRDRAGAVRAGRRRLPAERQRRLPGARAGTTGRTGSSIATSRARRGNCSNGRDVAEAWTEFMSASRIDSRSGWRRPQAIARRQRALEAIQRQLRQVGIDIVPVSTFRSGPVRPGLRERRLRSRPLLVPSASLTVRERLQASTAAEVSRTSPATASVWSRATSIRPSAFSIATSRRAS